MLVKNIHEGLEPPTGVLPHSIHLVKGDYLYYHYNCDGFDDKGWGCGYRSLQTLCSWCRLQLEKSGAATKPVPAVPSLAAIQQLLVDIGDKPETFVKSHQWIGSVEVAMVVDQLYDIPCKLVHVNRGSDLYQHMEEFEKHFKTRGSPVMMGGDCDAASKCLLGTCQTADNNYLLILDPHYYGSQPDHQTLIDNNMLLWKPVDSFMENSFYNLCLPQHTSDKLNKTTL